MNLASGIPLRLKSIIWAVSVCVWLTEAAAARSPLDADIVAYLDIARSCLAGNWQALVNGYWSPVYPILLAIWMKLTQVDRFHDALAVQVFGAISLIVAAFCFEYLLSSFFAFRVRTTTEWSAITGHAVPERAVWWIGYSLFFWIVTFLTPPSLQHPDILVFIVYLLASALCMELTYRQEWWRYGLLGIVLGLGYLTKAVMFPLGFVFLFALFLQTAERRRTLPRLILAAAVFLALALPFCVALSHSKGRLTFGDVGAINYRHIMGFDLEAPIPMGVPGPVAAPHIAEHVLMLDLGTYPPWADPSYGFKGGPLRFDLARQLNRTHAVLRGYFEIYFVGLAALVCGLLILLLGSQTALFAKRVVSQFVLWMPALIGLGLYATMRFEPRFLGGYSIGLFVAWMGAVYFHDSQAARITRPITLAVCLMLLLQSAVQAGHEGISLLRHAQHPDWQVAKTLQQMGLREGDRVSYMGDTLLDDGWAYIAMVKIVAEIPPEDVLQFWGSDEGQKKEVLDWLRSAGARVVVTHAVPNAALSMGWRKVGDTDYYILSLIKAES